MNILQWDKGGKLWRKLMAWRTYMMREKEERRKSISLKREDWNVFTNEDQASLNRQKREYWIVQSSRQGTILLSVLKSLTWIVNSEKWREKFTNSTIKILGILFSTEKTFDRSHGLEDFGTETEKLDNILVGDVFGDT